MTEEVKKAKYSYNAKMRNLMGENWRRISNALGIYNPSHKPETVKLIKDYLETKKQLNHDRKTD
jgi:hypothetical protein